MADKETVSRIFKRLQRAGADVPSPVVTDLAAFIELLARWNRKINLTALQIDPPSDEAIDRLIVEPVLATRRLLPNERVILDVGSGGGSPAIPILLAVPSVRLLMVEVKVRKSAFLREALRQLNVTRGTVETCRLEELLPRADLHEAADVVTIRAVRPDRRLLTAIQAFLKPGGRLLLFGSESSARPEVLPPFTSGHAEPLIPATSSRLLVLNKSQRLF